MFTDGRNEVVRFVFKIGLIVESLKQPVAIWQACQWYISTKS